MLNQLHVTAVSEAPASISKKTDDYRRPGGRVTGHMTITSAIWLILALALFLIMAVFRPTTTHLCATAALQARYQRVPLKSESLAMKSVPDILSASTSQVAVIVWDFPGFENPRPGFSKAGAQCVINGQQSLAPCFQLLHTIHLCFAFIQVRPL